MPSLTLTPFCLVLHKGCHYEFSLKTQTRGNEAEHIGLPALARQQETAQGNPVTPYALRLMI